MTLVNGYLYIMGHQENQTDCLETGALKDLSGGFVRIEIDSKVQNELDHLKSIKLTYDMMPHHGFTC